MGRVAVLLFALFVVGVSQSARAETLDLSIEHPERASRALDPSEPALLVGKAFVDRESLKKLDVALVVDVSSSVGAFAGADIDGDGTLERFPFAGDDSVLAVELVAARSVVDALTGEAHRVALAKFSGYASEWWIDDPPSLALHPLTLDRQALHNTIAAIPAQRPRGKTNLAAALDEGRTLLSASPEDRDRVLLLFSDGAPTRPYDNPRANVRAALEAASRCAAEGIRVHTFAIGTKALANPLALIRIADQTDAYFTPVETPGDLADLASWVAHAHIQDITAQNLTTGDNATRIYLDHDGTWSALVPIALGQNRLRIEAAARNGMRASREIVVTGQRGLAPQTLPLVEKHRRLLLEDRLAKTRAKTQALRELLRERLTEEIAEERRLQQESDKEVLLESERP